MSEQIITKQCSKCKQIQPLSEFNKDKYKKDGLYSSCRKCQNIYHRKAFLKWQKTEKGKKAMAEYRERNPVKTKARRRVNDAIKCNRMLPATHFNCFFCDEPAKQYHHHKGYKPQYHFDVIPVCFMCHRINHLKLNSTIIASNVRGSGLCCQTKT